MSEEEKYYQSQEFKELLEQYEQMVASGRSTYMDGDDLCDIAEYYNTHDYPMEQVRAVIDYALQLHPESATALAMLARMAIERGDMKEAENIADSIPNQQDRDVYFLRAEIMMRHFQHSDAFNMLYELKDTIEEEYSYYLADAADLFYDYQDYLHAIPFIDELGEKSPNWYRTWLLKAKIYMSLEQYEQAIPFIEQMLDADPFDVNSWHMAGEAYASSKQYDKALEATDYAIAIEPDHYGVLQLRAYCLYFLERVEDAAQIYEHVINATGGTEHDYLFYSYCLYDMGKTKEAYDAIKMAAEICTYGCDEEQAIQEQQAYIASTLGLMDEAFECIAKAEALSTDEAPEWPYDFYRVRVYAENEHLAEAMQLVANCISKARNEEEADLRRFQAAQVLFDVGCSNEVIVLLNQINQSNLTEEQIRLLYGYEASSYHRTGMAFLAWSAIVEAQRHGTQNIASYFDDFFPENVADADAADYYYQLVHGDWL